MNKDKLSELLESLFIKPVPHGGKRHIVFWYDEEQAYLDTVHSLAPDIIKVHVLRDNNNFATKKLIEHDDTENHYLIYAPLKKPDERSNWFLDTLLYSQEFTPDHTSLMMSECGITDLSLKPLVKKYALFFKSRERCNRLKSITSTFSEETLELSMIAFLVKEKSLSLEEIAKKLFLEGLEENQMMDELKKYSLEERFWHYIRAHYGYVSPHPTLKGLLSSIVLTALKDTIKEIFPDQWKSYILPQWSACVLFVNHWMNDVSTQEAYNACARELQGEFDLTTAVKGWSEKLLESAGSDIFEVFDTELIKHIVGRLENPHCDYEKLKKLCESRRISHWYTSYRHIYNAIENAMELIGLVEKLEKKGFICSSPSECIKAYTGELYKGDQAYRRFYTAYDLHRPDILKPLQERVENYYHNSFLKILSSRWSEIVERAMAGTWIVPEIGSQQEFYQSSVKKILDRDERNKVYVIISDALRYEAAEELVGHIRLDGKLRGDVEISHMLGVIPSYTALGMASLLPHDSIHISADSSVKVDGLDTATLDQRETVLRKYNIDSKALRYSEMKELSRDELRESLKHYRVVYVYHNIIDATGDKPETEKQVFDAVDKAFSDITDCIRRLVNAVSATSILVTSDHGFLYNRNPLDESDKLIKGTYKTIKELKRCVLIESEGDSASAGTMAVNMSYLLGKDTTLKAVTPKGMHRFKLAGPGVNYVHGGMSLQEIVIPLVRFRGRREATRKKVEITLTNTGRRITNNKYTLIFFQTERVCAQYLPRKLKVSLWDTDKNIQVSDEHHLIADLESDNAREREIKVIITLKNITYDSNKEYYLKLEEGASLYGSMIPFRIAIAFVNEFGL
ncbi:MAG: BREX-1 system phosphatase PglZ type A [Vulcanimicrobiota bacterium]